MNRRAIAVTVALAAAAAACARQQAFDKKGDTPGGLVRSRILQLMEAQRLPSVCAVVVKDGKTQLEECFGFANLEKQIKATPDTMYALASLTKPLTATGLMTLVERKLVNLDRPANDYLGDAKLVAHVGDASGATLRRLLLCTSGLPEHMNIFDANEKAQRPPMEQSLRRYGILVAPPGEAFTYSNFGYGILEHIMERVSGKEYAAFMKAQVFDPLGMTRTAVLTEPPTDDTVAVKYVGRGRPLPFSDYDHRGASAAYGSVRDLVKLARFISKAPLSGQRRILRDKTIDMMLTAKERDLPDTLLHLGWTQFEHAGYRVIHASGGMRGAASRLGIIAEARLISAIASNAYTSDLWEIEKTVFAAYLPGYAAKIKSRPPEKPAAPRAFSPPAALTGAWSGSAKTHDGDLPAHLSVADGGVRFELAGRSLPVIQIPPGIVDWKLSFENGVFTAPFGGNIRNSDTARSPHILYAVLKLRGDRLTGYVLAAAIDMKFTLPYWVELRKSPAP